MENRPDDLFNGAFEQRPPRTFKGNALTKSSQTTVKGLRSWTTPSLCQAVQQRRAKLFRKSGDHDTPSAFEDPPSAELSLSKGVA